jgi:hypothetical protein
MYMARKKTAEQHTESEASTPVNGGVKKVDAVRAALAEGFTEPDDAVAFIKQRFGIDLPKPQFSSYKSQEKSKKRAGQSGMNARGVRFRAATATPAASAASDIGIVADLAAVKRLVEKLGAGPVRDMVGLFE